MIGYRKLSYQKCFKEILSFEMIIVFVHVCMKLSTTLTWCLLRIADVHQQLQEYEQKIFGSVDGSNPIPLPALSAGMPSFSFGFPKGDNDPVPVPVPAPAPAPAFNTNFGATSIFAGRPSNVPTQGFTFGAGQTDISQTSLSGNIPNPNGSDIPMDSS